MEIEDQAFEITPTPLFKDILKQLRTNSLVLTKLISEKEKEEDLQKSLEVEYGELPIPVTESFCKKYFNVTLETIRNRAKTNTHLVIYGEGQEKFMFKSDIVNYVRSLGKDNAQK